MSGGLQVPGGMSINGGRPITMPFIVQETDQCPADRPWGVFTEKAHGSGEPAGQPHGCHPSKPQAEQQQKALYANVPEATGQGKQNSSEPDGQLQRPAWKLS